MPLLNTCLRLFTALFILTAFIYPAFITISGYFFLSNARGSLLYVNNEPRGSFLIAQKFSQDRYFWPRPSAAGYQTLPSGGSNLSPTSKKLRQIVEERQKALGPKAPPELIFSSASGLDPHISLETAFFQTSRIAKARSIPSDTINDLILKNVEGRQLGFIGPKYVNVLLLNQELDKLQP